MRARGKPDSRWRSGLALAALAVATGLTLANGASAQSDTLPARLACTFADGVTANYGDGGFKRGAPSPLSFEIDAIDLAGQKAALKSTGDRAAGDLRIVRALNANHFLEVAAEGFLNLTTVYDRDARSGLFPAVHSRHFGLFGQAVVAQYTGTCKVVGGS